MRRYLIQVLALVTILFVSCRDKEDTDTLTPKTIRGISIASENSILKIGTEYYIGVQYIKDYDEKDKVTLTVNNQRGTLIGEYISEYIIDQYTDFKQTKLLFKLPPNNQTGDFIVNLVINNGQESLEQIHKLRFITDYDLSTVWQSLDESFIYWTMCHIRRFKDPTESFLFICRPSSIIYLPTERPLFAMGNFYSTDRAYDQELHVPPFISGLSGRYSASFVSPNDRSLYALKIVNVKSTTNQHYKAEETHNEILSELGAIFVSVHNTSTHKVTTYEKGEFTLKVYENEGEVYTLITKE